MDIANMKAQAGASLGMQQGLAGAYAGNAQKVESQSDSILSRLNMIRGNFAETRASLHAAADKIVGQAPTPMASNGQIKGERPPAGCFLDALQQVIGDIEVIGAEIQDHLNRLHRPF